MTRVDVPVQISWRGKVCFTHITTKWFNFLVHSLDMSNETPSPRKSLLAFHAFVISDLAMDSLNMILKLIIQVEAGLDV